eukprot:TRINITY_DN2611_c0_g1_i1.p1 TRINITY_DN2611_c0_g1~~TRINITY_DN2611_c0_g1_i1.p1  ORF type:complete len:167 (+),score=24.55 TRINITY_DN2611_c0_g1_i1:194-694(+)
MGCNQTKNEDVKKSQEPRARQVNASPQATTTTAISVGVSPEKHNKADDLNLGKSYTDQREKEKEIDYFKKIIDKTAINFIDVSSAVAPLENRDAIDRAKDYEHVVRSIKVSNLSLFTVPSPASSSVETGKSIDNEDREFLANCGDQLSAAFKGMQVKDCGPIVVSF